MVIKVTKTLDINDPGILVIKVTKTLDVNIPGTVILSVGILGGPSLRTTDTMIGGQLNYFVLSKGFTSYTYLGEYGIEANWNKGVEDIAENVRRLITSHYSWPPQTTLETHLYLVSLMLHNPF